MSNSTRLLGGGVTIYGRSKRLGSPDSPSRVAFNDAVASENLVILPIQAEWAGLA